MKNYTPEEKLQSTHDSVEETLQYIKENGDVYNRVNGLASSYAQLGREYLKYRHDFDSFKKYTRESWKYYKDVLGMKDMPEYFEKKLYWAINYGKIIQYLCAGLIEEPRQYGRKVWAEVRGIRKFSEKIDEHMSMTFYPLLTGEDPDIFFEWIEKFYEYCNRPSGKKYLIGIAKVMDGTFQKNGKLIEEGLEDILKMRSSLKRSELGGMTPDNKVYCYWGMGIVNLAISRGIEFNIPEHDYISKKFLV